MVQHLHAEFHVSPRARRTRGVVQYRTGRGWAPRPPPRPAGSPYRTRSRRRTRGPRRRLRTSVPSAGSYIVSTIPPNSSRPGLPLHHLADHLDHLRQPFHREVLALDGHQHFGAKRPAPPASGRPATAGSRSARSRRPSCCRPGAGPGSRPSAGCPATASPRRGNCGCRAAAAGWRSRVSHTASCSGRSSSSACRSVGRQFRPVVALHCGSRSTSSVRPPDLRQGRRQVDGRGRLADAALLIRHAQDPSHALRPPCRQPAPVRGQAV